MNLSEFIKKKDKRKNLSSSSLSGFGKIFDKKDKNSDYDINGGRYKVSFNKKRKKNKNFVDISYGDSDIENSSYSSDGPDDIEKYDSGKSEEDDISAMIDIFLKDSFKDEKEFKKFKTIYSEYMDRLRELQKNPIVNYLISIHKMCDRELEIFSPPKIDKEIFVNLHKGKFINDYEVIKNFSEQLRIEQNRVYIYNMVNFANSPLFTGVIDANPVIINETYCLLGILKDSLGEHRLTIERLLEIILNDQLLKSLFMSMVYNNSNPKLLRTHTSKKVENQVYIENADRKNRLIKGIKEKL